jgi:hypothetical protein
MEQSSENRKYSINDLMAKRFANENKHEKAMHTTVLGLKSLDEKIYTETDFQKALDFIFLKNIQNNPFCGKKDCFDILPNHLHSEEKDKERKSKILLIIKTEFFIDK